MGLANRPSERSGEHHDLPCADCGLTPTVTVFWPIEPRQLCKDCLWRETKGSYLLATFTLKCDECGQALEDYDHLRCVDCSESTECGCGSALTCPSCEPQECGYCGSEFTCPACVECCNCANERSQYCDSCAQEDKRNACDECGEDGYRVLCPGCHEEQECEECTNPAQLCSDCANNIDRLEISCDLCGETIHPPLVCRQCAGQTKAADGVVSFVGDNEYAIRYDHQK